jgi:hypothetical protein
VRLVHCCNAFLKILHNLANAFGAFSIERAS